MRSIFPTAACREGRYPRAPMRSFTPNAASIAPTRPCTSRPFCAPASGLQLEGDVLVAPAAERPGFAGYQFGIADEETTSNERTPVENLPEADANGVATFPVSLARPPSSTRPQEAQIFIRMAEAGGRAVERKLVLPVAPAVNLIGIKPLFGDKSVAEGDKAEFDVVFVAPDGKQLPRDGLRYELLKMESRYQCDS